MKIDFESRARGTGGKGEWGIATRAEGCAGITEGELALLKHSFPDQEFVFLVTMPSALIDRARARASERPTGTEGNAFVF